MDFPQSVGVRGFGILVGGVPESSGRDQNGKMGESGSGRNRRWAGDGMMCDGSELCSGLDKARACSWENVRYDAPRGLKFRFLHNVLFRILSYLRLTGAVT